MSNFITNPSQGLQPGLPYYTNINPLSDRRLLRRGWEDIGTSTDSQILGFQRSDSYLLRTSEQSGSTCQENRRNGSRFDSLALLLIRLFLCLFISRLFHLQIDSRHQRVKSHQGRSSFLLTEDQLRDPVSCRLALFRALQKIWLNGEGEGAFFRVILLMGKSS